MNATAITSAQARFQSGLLAWLRRPDDSAGLREMIDVVRALASSDPATVVLWRSAESFLSTLLAGTLVADDAARQLCRRIERHLAACRHGAAPDDRELRDALFAFVSRREPAATHDLETVVDRSVLLGALGKAMGQSLAKTAEILPLLAGAATPRHAPERVAAWNAAARSLATAWQDFERRRTDDCRTPATQLVAAALAINTAGALGLAEALAEACAVAEDPARREHPILRAAVAAALEIGCDRDGPNHAHFDARARNAIQRLERAMAEVTPSARPEPSALPDG